MIVFKEEVYTHRSLEPRDTAHHTETPGEAPGSGGGAGGRRRGENRAFIRVLVGTSGQHKIGVLSNLKIA